MRVVFVDINREDFSLDSLSHMGNFASDNEMKMRSPHSALAPLAVRCERSWEPCNVNKGFIDNGTDDFNDNHNHHSNSSDNID